MRIKMNKMLSGSMTVEASIVVSITILALFGMLKFSLSLHDEILSGIFLNTAVEKDSHRGEALTTEEIEEEGTRRLSVLLSHGGYTMELSEEGDSIVGTIHSIRGSREMRMKPCRPQKHMREWTILEELAEK